MIIGKSGNQKKYQSWVDLVVLTRGKYLSFVSSCGGRFLKRSTFSIQILGFGINIYWILNMENGCRDMGWQKQGRCYRCAWGSQRSHFQPSQAHAAQWLEMQSSKSLTLKLVPPLALINLARFAFVDLRLWRVLLPLNTLKRIKNDNPITFS